MVKGQSIRGIERLPPLARVLYERKAAEYRALQDADLALSEDAQRLRSLTTIGTAEFHVAGADRAWVAYRETQLRKISSRRAQLRVEMEMKKSELAIAFGRKEAVARVLSR